MERVGRLTATGMAGALAVAFLLASGVPAEAMRLQRSDPDHVRPPASMPETPAQIPPRTRFSTSRIVYSLPDGLKGFASFDRTLSHLCQRGAFGQKMDGRYWAATPERRYGVAFPSGANLDDPQKRAQAGKVYFFDGQDSRCSVYVGDQAKLMPHYKAGG